MVKIRLARHGAKKRPYYHVVVSDSRRARDGKFIDDVGRYNPQTSPHYIEFNTEKMDKWISEGAQMSDTVSRLYSQYKAQG